MKKIIKIMTVMSVLLYGMIICSCGVADAVKESVGDTYKKWYKYCGDKEVDIPIAGKSDSEDSDSGQTLKNAEYYFYFDQDAGLTVAIQTKTKQEVALLKGLYSQEIEIVTGATKQYTLEEFGKVKWTALWSSGKIKKDSAPLIYTNPEQCIVIGGDKDTDAKNAKIQWKKVLANILLDKLLED